MHAKVYDVTRPLRKEDFYGYEPTFQMYSNSRNHIVVNGVVDVYNHQIHYQLKAPGYYAVHNSLDSLIEDMDRLGVKEDLPETEFCNNEEI